jgi:hypothetical protein
MHTRDDIVAAARAVAERLGTRKLSLGEFRRATGMNHGRIYKLFGGWRGVCAAAGLETTEWSRRYSDDEIFEAMRAAFVAGGGVTTLQALERHFRFGNTVLVRRFRVWRRMLVEFAQWQACRAPDFPHAAELAERIAAIPEVRRKTPPIAPGPFWPSNGTTPCGEPLGYRGLMYAPLNEDGVILAFGMLAADLGFSVEKVSKTFPDCTAKRRVGESRWEPVRIEFEYRSRNFRDHGHDPAKCDLIVCWEHDWPGAPIEVLELRAAIARLAVRGRTSHPWGGVPERARSQTPSP